VKGRILAVAAVLAAAVAVGVPLLYQELLGLGDKQVLVTRYCLGAFAPLALLGAAAVVLRLRVERRSVLELPSKLAQVFLAVAAVVLAALLLGMYLSGARGPIVLTLVLCSSALLALPAVPLYAYARAALLPLATGLGNEKKPDGRRVPIGLQIGYTVVAVSSAALVPAALFGAAQLDRANLADARARATLAAERLSRASLKLDVAAATKLLTRTPLDGGERLVLVAPSGTQLPDDIGPEVAEMPFVEKPLDGVLRGGSLRVFYSAHSRPHGPLMLAVLFLVGLTLWMAAGAARAVTDDMVGITRQIERVARGEPPGPTLQLSTQEVRRVALAVNRLLERIPRLTVESFLAIERASDAQRLKSQFLANMSHDLRSPLNSILGFSELLLRGLEGDIQPGQRVTLAMMHATGLRLLRLLNEILDTAKVESGKMELHRQQASPAELIRQAVQEARRGRPPSLTDQLSVELRPGMTPIHVDPLRMTQAATHLVNHAFGCAPLSGAGPIQLRAQELANPRQLILEIEYPRPPWWNEEKDYLFDGFRLSGSRPGLHLALPLAKRLVEIHGGALELAPSEDSRVRLRGVIPLAAAREKRKTPQQ
jgi:signal transduction histidine kinase